MNCTRREDRSVFLRCSWGQNNTPGNAVTSRNLGDLKREPYIIGDPKQESMFFLTWAPCSLSDDLPGSTARSPFREFDIVRHPIVGSLHVVSCLASGRSGTSLALHSRPRKVRTSSDIPVSSPYDVTVFKLREIHHIYGGKSGYSVHSPSVMLISPPYFCNVSKKTLMIRFWCSLPLEINILILNCGLN